MERRNQAEHFEAKPISFQRVPPSNMPASATEGSFGEFAYIELMSHVRYLGPIGVWGPLAGSVD